MIAERTIALGLALVAIRYSASYAVDWWRSR